MATFDVRCGDALELLKELPDESVDAIITDPPYNTGMKREAKDEKGKKGAWLQFFFSDKYAGIDYDRLTWAFLAQAYRVLKPDSGMFVFMGWKSVGDWQTSASHTRFTLKNIIVWDKVVHGLNYQNYAYSHEFILFFAKGNFQPDNKSTPGKFYKDIWRVQRILEGEAKEEHHETEKPLSLLRVAISHLSERGGGNSRSIHGNGNNRGGRSGA